MTELSIHFVFSKHTRENLPNGEVYDIRKCVAELFSEHQFGAIGVVDGTRFITTYAIPTTDELDEDGIYLTITFHFHFPFSHGNFSGVFASIPSFREMILNRFDTDSLIRFDFTD